MDAKDGSVYDITIMQEISPNNSSQNIGTHGRIVISEIKIDKQDHSGEIPSPQGNGEPGHSGSAQFGRFSFLPTSPLLLAFALAALIPVFLFF